LLPLFFLGCSGKDDAPADDGADADSDTDTDTDTDIVTGDFAATVAPSTYVPAVAIVSFGGTGDASVEYGLDGAFDHVTPVETGLASHAIPVIGLKASHTYSWRAVLDNAGVRTVSAPGTFTVPASPYPALSPTIGDSTSFSGYVMLTVLEAAAPGDAVVGFFDADGDWVWWVESPGHGIISSRFGNDGTSIVYGEYDNDDGVDDGHIVRQSMDGQTRSETRILRGHHDFVEHTDGTFAFLSMDFEERDMGEPAPIKFGADVIRKVPEGQTDADPPPEVIFSTFDDYPAEPSFVCSHVQPTAENIGPKVGEPAVLEWTHGNSLVYIASENAYYLNSRYTDWLLKIDATDGHILWQLNGAATDFSPGTPLWSHSHLSDLWADGALVFDNGDHYIPSKSQIIKVGWDETAMTAQVELAIDPPGGTGFATALGDARRLPDGRILGAWGNLGFVDVYEADGSGPVWQGGISPPLFAARLRYTEDLRALPDED
jgi:hypothetical protein